MMLRVRVILTTAAIAVSSTAIAGNPELLACGSLETPALARQCMLERQMADGRIAGERVGGAASPQVMNAGLTADEIAALQARQQMAAMVDERDRAILGPASSVGGLGIIAPLILLLALLGASGSGGGAPVSPS